MLFNCFHCGRVISDKKDICVYCKTNVAHFQQEFRGLDKNKMSSLQEKYKGTLFGELLHP